MRFLIRKKNLNIKNFINLKLLKKLKKNLLIKKKVYYKNLFLLL
jgi:hypothetical protein